MKIVTNQDSQVSIFEDGVGTKEVITTLMQNLKCEDDAFYCVDIGDILLKHYKWRKLLPRIEPFYAIKCNTDPLILELMANLGMGFDCASKVEIETMLNYGVKSSHIVFANPCKQLSHVKYAVAHGIDLMTFDNEMELRKIKTIAPKSRLLLRILTDDSKSLCQLGIKYGAALDQCQYLLKAARELDLNVVGVSFHVGSGCFDATAFKTAVESARLVFDWACMEYFCDDLDTIHARMCNVSILLQDHLRRNMRKFQNMASRTASRQLKKFPQAGFELARASKRDIGFDFSLLDVGGGFPGSASKDICFEEVCSVLNNTLDECFPTRSGVRIIAEPGRFYVSTAFTLVTNVTSRRETSLKLSEPKGNHGQHKTAKGYMYYINEGVYGSFNCLIFDHASVEAIPLRDCHSNEEKFPSSIWGPSCDSMDCVLKNTMLPECNVGDWLYFKEMGAYTLSAASGFNGFLPPNCYYFVSLSAKTALEELLPTIPAVSVKVKKNVEDHYPALIDHTFTDCALSYIDIKC